MPGPRSLAPPFQGGESGSIALLDLSLPTVPENLALDEALLVEADEGRAGAVLRFWESDRFAVILGASRRLADEVFVAACADDDVQVLRRSSGGGTVLIGPGALNVTLVLSTEAAPGLGAVDVAQRFVLDRIAASLCTPEEPVVVMGSGDLTIGSRKFAGSAQRRLRGWFLVHATILYNFPLARISRYLAVPPRRPAYREGRAHDEFLRNLDIPRKLIVQKICTAWPLSHALSPTTDVPHQLVTALLAERFANRAWIERL
jgi:lipoate-protein ligase A